MMLAISFIVICVFIGIFFGGSIFKTIQKKKERVLINNALEVIKGERENNIEIDGKILKVDTFVMRDDNDKEIKIKLNGEKAK